MEVAEKTGCGGGVSLVVSGLCQGRQGRPHWRKPGPRLPIIPLLAGWKGKVAKIAKFLGVGFGDVGMGYQ
jgi:hypothetical protein